MERGGAVPKWEKRREKGEVGVYGNWTITYSLIRNLEKAFWFGTLRVLEEDRKQGTGSRERGTGPGKRQQPGGRSPIA
jgi:hypothetical protein